MENLKIDPQAPIGSEFEFEGETYKVERKPFSTCTGCDLSNIHCDERHTDMPQCDSDYRDDNVGVIFKKVE